MQEIKVFYNIKKYFFGKVCDSDIGLVVVKLRKVCYYINNYVSYF